MGLLVLMVTGANRRLQTASRLDPGPGHSLGLAPATQSLWLCLKPEEPSGPDGARETKLTV